MSHKFGYVNAFSSSKFRKPLISFFFLHWPSYDWVENCSNSMSMWSFCCFCYWSPALVYGDLIEYKGSLIFFCFCWGLFCVQLLWRSFCEELRRRYILFVLGWNILYISVKSLCLFSLCFNDLCIGESGIDISHYYCVGFDVCFEL